ncbi:MAG: hypothetical protein HFF50_00965 [Lawsonibacter sp.]|nr:hypothetical protein [Lawsonibacter sp.]
MDVYDPTHTTHTELSPSNQVGEALMLGVLVSAASQAGHGIRPPALYQTLCRCAAQTEYGTPCSFLFQAMVDRLLEEHRTLHPSEGAKE